MRMIIPLVQKHCINGISKEDAENLKEIPTIYESMSNLDESISDLDERVTDLEQSSGGSKWEEIDVSTYAKANAYVSEIFTYDGDHYYTKYPMILVYRSKMFYIPTGTGVTGINYQYTEDNYNGVSPTQVAQIIEEVSLYYIFLNRVSDLEFTCPTCHVIFKNDNTITINNYPSSIMYRNRLRIFIKK